MIELTNPDGTQLTIDGSLVVRARRTISGEADDGEANTRIDWVVTNYVKETIDEVAPLIAGELDSLISFTSRDGSKIWIDGSKAAGPLPLTDSQQDGVVHSCFKLQGIRQFVIETPDEVRAAIGAAGGTALP